MDNMENRPDPEVQVTINRPIRMLHFSDGIEEEIEKDHVDGLESAPTVTDTVDTKTLSWGPWLSHYAWKSGSNVLYAVDYAGESLANFFGITTPKYQLEINEYERVKEEKRKMDEDSVGWVPKNTGGDIPLVLNEPVKDVTKNGNEHYVVCIACPANVSPSAFQHFGEIALQQTWACYYSILT